MRYTEDNVIGYSKYWWTRVCYLDMDDLFSNRVFFSPLIRPHDFCLGEGLRSFPSAVLEIATYWWTRFLELVVSRRIKFSPVMQDI